MRREEESGMGGISRKKGCGEREQCRWGSGMLIPSKEGLRNATGERGTGEGVGTGE